jgi:hypothetical protein
MGQTDAYHQMFGQTNSCAGISATLENSLTQDESNRRALHNEESKSQIRLVESCRLRRPIEGYLHLIKNFATDESFWFRDRLHYGIKDSAVDFDFCCVECH